LYSGEQFDAKIGQQYLRARYYDPVTGRFNRLDPFFGNLSDPQSFHKYLYTHGDPVNEIDPSGLMSVGGTLSSVAICTGIASISSNVIAGVWNTFNGKPFFPDASLLGVSGTILYDPSQDIQTFLPKVFAQIGKYIEVGMHNTNRTSLAQFLVDFYKYTQNNLSNYSSKGKAALKTIKNLPNPNSPLSIGLTFAVELVTTATDLKQGYFFSLGFTVSTNMQPGSKRFSGNVSGYAGAVWNLSTISGYEDPFISVGLNFGYGSISAGINVFTSPGSDSYGVATSISFGTPADNVSGSITVGFAKEMWSTDRKKYADLYPYYFTGLWYQPALASKAQQNDNVR
jgi:RHS repeat-associated protein